MAHHDILNKHRKLPRTLTIISKGDFFFNGCTFLFFIMKIETISDTMNRNVIDDRKIVLLTLESSPNKTFLSTNIAIIIINSDVFYFFVNYFLESFASTQHFRHQYLFYVSEAELAKYFVEIDFSALRSDVIIDISRIGDYQRTIRECYFLHYLLS